MLFKSFFIYVTLLFFWSCDRSPEEYHKYVYSFPVTINPDKAMLDSEVWVSSLVYRNLVNLDPNGLIRNDLAKEIEHIDGSTYKITLKSNLRYHSGKKITGHSIEEIYKEFSHEFVLGQVRENSFTITFVQHSPFNLHQLTMPKYGIYRSKNVDDGSGPYRYDLRKKLLWKVDRSNYPRIIKLIRSSSMSDVKKLSIDNEIAFDTSLAQMQDSNKFGDFRGIYRIGEYWGIALNHEGRFQLMREKSRIHRCIRDSKIALKIFPDYDDLSRDIVSIHSEDCVGENFTLLIPSEIDHLGSKLCKELAPLNVYCEFVPYLDMIERIKSKQFDAAFLSLNSDYPYIEHLESFFNCHSGYKLACIETDEQELLLKRRGLDFIDRFWALNDANHYFVEIAAVKRVVFASKIKNYLFSFTHPKFDVPENLIRD